MPLTMPNYMSIFKKTPEDYLNSRWTKRKGPKTQGPLEPGLIRVRFRWEMPPVPGKKIELDTSSSMEHIFPMDANHGLDLKQIGQYWGFERCKVINMKRGEALDLADPYSISPLALYLLTDNLRDPTITVVEHTTNANKERKNKRITYRRYVEDVFDFDNLRALFFLFLMFYFLWYVLWARGPRMIYLDLQYAVQVIDTHLDWMLQTAFGIPPSRGTLQPHAIAT